VLTDEEDKQVHVASLPYKAEVVDVVQEALSCSVIIARLIIFSNNFLYMRFREMTHRSHACYDSAY